MIAVLCVLLYRLGRKLMTPKRTYRHTNDADWNATANKFYNEF
jgi:hypothetical protein